MEKFIRVETYDGHIVFINPAQITSMSELVVRLVGGTEYRLNMPSFEYLLKLFADDQNY